MRQHTVSNVFEQTVVNKAKIWVNIKDSTFTIIPYHSSDSTLH